MSSPTPLRIGVLYEDTQMTDLAGLDIFGNLTSKTIDLMASLLPEFSALKSRVIPISFLYISSSLSPALTTPDMRVVPTHTYATAPRDLDIIFIGGPNPQTVHPDSLVFLKEASVRTKTIITTCTGAMWLAGAGVLDGRKATTNRFTLEIARQMFPKVEWLDQRWVIGKGVGEGSEIWTSGAAAAGIDMVIEYALQHFDRGLVELGCVGLDFKVEGRNQFYTVAHKGLEGF